MKYNDGSSLAAMSMIRLENRRIPARIDPRKPRPLRLALVMRDPNGGAPVSVHHVPIPSDELLDAERVIRSLQGKGEVG